MCSYKNVLAAHLRVWRKTKVNIFKADGTETFGADEQCWLHPGRKERLGSDGMCGDTQTTKMAAPADTLALMLTLFLWID